jgi:hypothetical protein
LVACAASRTNEVRVSDDLDVSASRASVVVEPLPEAAPVAASTAPSLAALALEPLPAAPQDMDDDGRNDWNDGQGLHDSRFTVKGGYFGADEDALDDGYIFNLSWMNFMTRIFALELEVGYLDADGSDSGVDSEVWAIPIMLNGRANLPIWVLDVYAGLGAGTFYYDAEVSGAASGSDDGFLLGGNAFVGASVGVADSIALGLEGKYYVSEDASDDFDSSLDAFALMLTLGFSR